MRIGFLGFGEAGRAFQEGLAAADPELTFCAYDILLDSADERAAMRNAMSARGVAVAAPSGLTDCQWVFSAVSADQSLIAVEALAPHLHPGQTVIDINSVSPGRKQATAELVVSHGADYLDMAVMAPVHPKKQATPVLIAGTTANMLAPQLKDLGFTLNIAGEDIGQATAIKMVRSLFVKGLEAICVEALMAAKASGCYDDILSSLSNSFEGLGWPDFAAYEFERTMTHGKRRAAEMRECAATIADLGLHGALAEQIANIQEAMGQAGSPSGVDTLEERVQSALQSRLSHKD